MRLSVWSGSAESVFPLLAWAPPVKAASSASLASSFEEACEEECPEEDEPFLEEEPVPDPSLLQAVSERGRRR
ncbi:hypothetical protein [Streptomyces sp. NPDC050145]|uniref:hypothetical protein n=1 Tax=Streptomyces sp. NPDC050145 TaxID=3365602 RepID=UPI0037B980B3